MSGGGRPPAQPDYVGAAREQGQWNLAAARTGAQLNRVNQVGPGGSVNYSNNGDQWTQTTNLSPEQLALYNSTTGNALDRANIAGNSAGSLAQALQNPIDFSGLPNRTGYVKTAPYQPGVNADSLAQSNVDLSSIPGLNSDFGAERQRVEDSLYSSATERLDPEFAQREEATRTQLMNQGIREGSEAWNNAMRDFGNSRQDAYGNARDRAIQAGGAEQSRLYADALRNRQQNVGEEFGTAEFANRAAQQRFGNEAARTNIYNAAQDSDFNQGLANAQLGNRAREAGINEELLPRNQLMNEFMSLYGDYSGSGTPQGLNPGQVPTPAAGDYAGAANQGYQYQNDIYNYQQQRSAQNTNSAIGLATALAMIYSDRRLKTDIERVGELPNGIPTYRFRYKGDDTTQIGVMSDDVREVMPDAVIPDESGFDRVNYAMIGAGHLIGAN